MTHRNDSPSRVLIETFVRISGWLGAGVLALFGPVLLSGWPTFAHLREAAARTIFRIQPIT